MLVSLPEIKQYLRVSYDDDDALLEQLLVTAQELCMAVARLHDDEAIAASTNQLRIGILYAVAYTLKMSYKTDYRIEGFFDYVVPPLEGFWWQDGVGGIDYSDKSTFNWISVIRLPDFVTQKDFDWATGEAEKKKHLDCSKAEFLTIDEGLCVQIMHIGPFDDEPATVSIMNAYLLENGYENDFSGSRLHHEIYLSDARKVAPEKWKTVIRHPIKRKEA